MVFQEPKVEFIPIHAEFATVNTGSGYSVCERLYGGNVNSAEICNAYGDVDATEAIICGWFCDTTSANREQEINDDD